MKWLDLLADAIRIVVRAIADGATDDEIAERLSAPGTVGAAIVASAWRRKSKIDAAKKAGGK